MSRSVRYSKEQRQTAKRHKKFLVTINVDGREIGDDSCTVQILADVKLAQRMAKLAVKLMRELKVESRESE